MPRSFTDTEKEAIRLRLKKEAAACLATYGLKKTTVDELVIRSQISKGTFYLFYASKELLIFDLLLDFHDEVDTVLKTRLAARSTPLDAPFLTNLLMDLFRQADRSGLIRPMLAGDIELLMRKLPQDVVASHLKQDEDLIKQIAVWIPGAAGKNLDAFSAAFRAAFLTLLHKREIGEELFEASLELLIHGLVLQLFDVQPTKGDIHDD